MSTSRTQKILQLALASQQNIGLNNELLTGYPIDTIPIIFESSGNETVVENNTTDGNLQIIPVLTENLGDGFSLCEDYNNILTQGAEKNESRSKDNFQAEFEDEAMRNVAEAKITNDSEYFDNENGELNENDSEIENEKGMTDAEDHDPDYETEETCDSDTETEAEKLQKTNRVTLGLMNEYGDISEGRKRKSKADKNEWKRIKNAQLRMRGKEYIGYSRGKDKIIKHNVIRKARVMGVCCTSKVCKKTQTRKCNLFTEESRKKIFQTFWNELNWNQRKVYVCSHVSRAETKRKTKVNEELSRRSATLRYTLSNNNEKLPVCRQMFLNTLGIGSFTVQSWVKNSSCGMIAEKEILNKNRRDKNYRVYAFNGAQQHLIKFLQELPKQPSHYVRKDTNKLYLEQHFVSFKQLFDAYINNCKEENQVALGRQTFTKHFKEQNLSLFTPKKDQCDMCIEHEHGNIDEETWNQHITNKNQIRLEKQNDIERANRGEIILLTMDLQAVKVSPYLNATAIYFKTKLCSHNFTVYNITTRQTTCYWFTEIDSDLSASTFVSCLTDYLIRHCVPKKLPVVIYSDGCTYQNRNVVMANGLLNFAILHGITITQKYLERGHTQMEVDSVHSAIERRLKNKKIHLPSDYLRATEEARRKPEPYECIKLEFDFFFNYSKPEYHRFKTIRPGKKTSDPTVTDIKGLRYCPNGDLRVKIDISQDWQELPIRSQVIPPIEIYPKLHSAPLKITKKKWSHLQDLKSVIPKDCHAYYDSLPYSDQ